MVFLLAGWLCILIRVVVTQVCTHRVYLQRLTHTGACESRWDSVSAVAC